MRHSFELLGEGEAKNKVAMKKYISPTIKSYDMAPVGIMQGSLEVKGRIGISTFYTDEDDWTTETNSQGEQSSKYNFWE